MQKNIALVACVSRKAASPMPAQDLYTSAWFDKASAYARQVADEWYILSAKHGLVSPDMAIAPYDQTLNGMPAAERRAWASRVLDDLSNVLEPGDHVVILAGKAYRSNLVGPIREMGCTVEVPMQGLGIGQQLRWLNQRLEKDDD